MIEPERAVTDLEGDIEVIEAMLKYVIKYVMDRCPEEIAFCDKFIEQGLIQKLTDIVEKEFARVSYTEAIRLLEPHKDEFQYPVFWGADIQTEHERYLTEKIFNRPTFLTDYPKDIKAFYMKQNDDGKTVRGMDVLFPKIGEIIGGSQREESYDKLMARINELHMDMTNLWWYLDTRRFGSAPHSGFGLGFQLLRLFVTGLSNIR